MLEKCGEKALKGSRRENLEVVLGASVKSLGTSPWRCARSRTRGEASSQGAGLDDSWKETVRKLIEDSAYVLLVPEDTAGTSWEMETIAENPSTWQRG